MSERRRSGSFARRALILSAVAVAAVSASVAALSGVSEPATVTETARRGEQVAFPNDRFVPPRRALLLSDSVIAGLRTTDNLDRLQGTTWIPDLEPCRRLVARSCPAPGGGPRPPTVVEELRALTIGPDEFDLLVIATGYNDWPSRFASDFDAVVAEGRRAGFEHIVWLTYRTEGRETLAPTYRQLNAILREAVAGGAPVTLWDFDAFTSGRSSWFGPDGYHLVPSGARAIADWLSGKAASFDVT